MEKQLKQARKEMELLPHGSLRCTSSNGSVQYFVDGKYMSKKNLEIVRGIAQREYYEQVIPEMEQKLKKLYDLERIYRDGKVERRFEDYCTARKKLVMPIIDSMEMRIQRFMDEEYEPGRFDEENKTEFITNSGERVRSKSELIIADELYRYQVPYRYEKPLKLCNWGQSVVCRPDFTIMNGRNGKIYIYEHLGMMDDPQYVVRNMDKLDLYEKNGYLIGKNLILTHETSDSPLKIAIVDSYIEQFFL